MAPQTTTVVLLAILVAASLPAFASAGVPTPGEFVVGFHELPEQARAGEYGGERVTRVDEALGFAVVQVRNAEAFELRARHDPNVRYVQTEQYASVEATANDQYFANQYGLAKINAPTAWDVTRGSTAIVVAVVDTGVDAAHPDLAGALLPGYDFQYNDGTPQDDCGHGTGVTGVVAARVNNGVGVAGTAQVTVMPLKAMGMQADGKCYGPFSAVASSIRYAADNGARVISMSLGALGTYDAATNDAINYAYSKGVLLVASAGNNGPCTNCVSWPAAHPSVIAVSATDSANAQAYFSSAGPDVEVAAPGKSIYTTMRNGLYGPMSGTSLAAPFVSGGLALAISAQPTVSHTELRARLAATALDLGAAGKDDVYGAGLMQLPGLVGSAPAPAPAPNAAPTASFTASVSGMTVSVDANASSDSDGRIVDWRWSWGDGIAFSTTCAWAGHTYAASGTYTITLTVTDDKGATASTTRTVTLSAPNVAPDARFTLSVADLVVSTDARGSSDPDGSIASYAWAWGDGTTGSGATASHAYAGSGTYTVTLTVTDDRGAQSTSSASVTVNAPAPAPAPVKKMHVDGLDGLAKRTGKTQSLTWTASIADASGVALDGATVTATVGGTSYTAVSSGGVATFRLSVPRTTGVTYTLCVGDVSLTGWTYDASANTASCRSLTTA